MKVDRAIQKGMHGEQHTSILFGLPSVTPLTACRAALLLLHSEGQDRPGRVVRTRGGPDQALTRQEESS
ncbi:hypothetical protein VZT92_009733 [Zoarces viviparus]|uniref:Uncharacterized protein n=1 Tax=Zoarces viviparus TaxID=48416 RepID=A0AAW1FCT1_ZOAVI